VNARIRVFLTVVSLLFAGLLVIQLASVLLHRGDQPSPSAVRQQVVDRPAEPLPAANPPRTPPGRSLIRHAAQWTAKAS
jgi:hypothetical protein